MTEFTEKLNSSELVSKAWDEIDRDQANAGLLIDTISNEFKDWQPPKEPVVFPSWMPSTIDSLLDCIDKQLVVIPQLVADFIESENNNEENREGTLVFEHYNSYQGNGSYSELHKWIANNFNDFLEAIVNGYTVEKEKKYILKHIDLSEQYKNESFYLSHSRYAKLKHESFSKDFDVSEIERCHFTQSEIDKLNIGSYEQIEVIE